MVFSKYKKYGEGIGKPYDTDASTRVSRGCHRRQFHRRREAAQRQPAEHHNPVWIERQYKVELFHRIGRGVRLTQAGTALLPMVRRLFTSLDEATAYLQDLRGPRHHDAGR